MSVTHYQSLSQVGQEETEGGRQDECVGKSLPGCACSVTQLCPILDLPIDCSPPVPLSMGFSQQE